LHEGPPQFAAVQVAGHDDRAGAAALERARVAGQVEVGFFFVRVVALGAIGLDEGLDVVLVGGFVLREQEAGAEE
jgi:hypothetical protein